MTDETPQNPDQNPEPEGPPPAGDEAPSAGEDAPRGETPPTGEPRKLTRSTGDAVVGGVASGLGRYFGVDPILFRIGFVVLTFVGAVGILAYLILLAFVPSDGEQRDGGTGAKAIGVAGTIVLAIALVTFLSPPLFLFGP